MQSKKRFTETAVWEEPWFADLTSEQKLFWFYLNDRCDNIGLWKPNWRLAFFHLNIVNDQEEFAKHFLNTANTEGEQVIVFDNGDWFLPEFVRFQYCKSAPLNPRNPAHRSYINQIYEKNLIEWFCEKQPEVLPVEEIENHRSIHPKPTLSNNEKSSKRPLKDLSESDKDKEKEKEQEKGKDMDEDKEPPSTVPFKSNTPGTTLKKNKKETGIEFEMRNKGYLEDTPF